MRCTRASRHGRHRHRLTTPPTSPPTPPCTPDSRAACTLCGSGCLYWINFVDQSSVTLRHSNARHRVFRSRLGLSRVLVPHTSPSESSIGWPRREQAPGPERQRLELLQTRATLSNRQRRTGGRWGKRCGGVPFFLLRLDCGVAALLVRVRRRRSRALADCAPLLRHLFATIR